MSSNFGTLFRISTFGESHCKGVGVIIDGCPPKIKLNEEDIQLQLSRRKPGQSELTTKRNEEDKVTILSGTENNLTLGTPIALFVANKDQHPTDYKEMLNIPRPSHADFTYLKKYGIKASSGGGRSSARETIGTVASGAVAEKILKEWFNIEIIAWVSSVANITCPHIDMDKISRNKVDQFITRCPDEKTSNQMIQLITQTKKEKDSLGGTITCVCRNVPAGLGEPVYDKLEAKLAQAMLAIPSTKGFEIGSGFNGTLLKGSEHNDLFQIKNGKLKTRTNNSGGIQGGISNGENIYFKIAFKPPATIGQAQTTVDYAGNNVVLEAKGRHDPCVLPRAVPVVETMAALVLMDMVLQQKARKELI